MSWVHETILYACAHRYKNKRTSCPWVCLYMVKALRCICTVGEIRSEQGHCQGLDVKGRSQPPARHDPSKLGRRKDVRGWDSVPGIHSEPTLKTDDARPQQPWRSNRVKMQAVNEEAFAMPVFNYWHFQRCTVCFVNSARENTLTCCFNPISFIRPRHVSAAVMMSLL